MTLLDEPPGFYYTWLEIANYSDDKFKIDARDVILTYFFARDENDFADEVNCKMDYDLFLYEWKRRGLDGDEWQCLCNDVFAEVMLDYL